MPGSTGVNFHKTARLDPPLFKLLGFPASESEPPLINNNNKDICIAP